jgi:hypothetical protein
MYSVALVLHSWLRWAALLLLLIAVVRAIAGRGSRPYSSADETVGKWLVIVLDIQLVIGLLLYAVLSPITQAVFADFGGAMRNPGLRFWAVEHLLGMVVAIALVHVGRVKIRKAVDDRRRHTLAAVFYGIALIIVLGSIPWPGMPAGRPLIRGF